MQSSVLLIVYNATFKYFTLAFEFSNFLEIIYKNCQWGPSKIYDTPVKLFYYFVITFVNCSFSVFPRDEFHVFMALNSLIFVNSKMVNLSGTFPKQFYNTLEELVFETNFPRERTLIDFLGRDVTYKRLNTVKIDHPTSPFYSISAENFTSTPFLKILELINCGIEKIMDNSFDSIVATLQMLNLSGNLLIAIPPTLLRDVISHVSSQFAGIDLSDNPLVCQSELEMMIEMGFWRSTTLNRSIFDPKPTCDGASNQTVRHRNTSIIHPEKLCLNLNVSYFFYPKYSIKLNEPLRILTIKSARTDAYRILMKANISPTPYKSKWGYSNEKCPKKVLLREAIKCFLVSESIELPVRGYLKNSKMNLICINYLSGHVTSFWPLSCILFADQHLDAGFSAMLVCIYFGCALGSFVVSTGITIYMKRLKGHPLRHKEHGPRFDTFSYFKFKSEIFSLYHCLQQLLFGCCK